MKIFYTTLVVLLLLIAGNCHAAAGGSTTFEKLDMAQIITGREALETSLRQHFVQLSEALIAEFNYKESGKVLKYLPSLGYNFFTQSPHLSYSTGALYAAINDKHLKAAKIRSIRSAMEVSFQAELAKLHKHYDNLEAEVACYNHALDLYQLHQAVFDLKQAQYQSLQISPLEFLDSQIKFKKEAMKLRERYTAILKLKHLVIDVAKARRKAALYTRGE